MIRKPVFAVLCLLLIWASLAFAQDETEKTILSQLSIAPGTEVSVVFNRDVNLDNTDTSGEMDLEWYLATVDIGFAEWLTITPKLGIMHQAFTTDQYEGVPMPIVGGTLGEIEATSEVGLALGVEANMDVYTTKDMPSDLLDDITISLNGEYLYGRTELDEVDFGGLELDNPIRNDISLHQFEIGAYIRKPIGIITPYFGVAYSDLVGEYDFELAALNIDEDIDADDNVGIRLGASVKPLKNLELGMDVKLVDEFAIGGRGRVKF